MTNEFNHTPCVSTEEPACQARSNSGKRGAYCVMKNNYTSYTLEELTQRENQLIEEIGRLEFYEITGQINRQVYRLKKTDLTIDVLTLQREMKRRSK